MARIEVKSLIVECEYGNGHPVCDRRATAELWYDLTLIGRFCDRDLAQMRAHFMEEMARAERLLVGH